jgi:MFS transporter, DHA1 family, multidrug resistance protein
VRRSFEIDLKELATKHITWPVHLLFTKPIVLLMKSGVGGLPYLATVFSRLLSFTIVIIPYKSYTCVLEANKNIPMPEWRLLLVIIGRMVFAVSFPWIGWTGDSGKNPLIVPALAGFSLGFGIFAVFIRLTKLLCGLVSGPYLSSVK